MLMCMLAAVAVAQERSLRGVVLADGDVPVDGATVLVYGTSLGTATNAKGEFAISVADAMRDVRLMVSCVGYADTLVDVGVRHGAPVVVHLREDNTVLAYDVDVVAAKRQSGFEQLDARSALSAVSVDGGVESVVKSQMGVSSNSELSSQYRVRGGNFDENMVYVNNIEIYRPFLIRSGEQEGLSFVNPDMVESLSFSSGGFDASYGDRMASVLDVRYKRPASAEGSARLSMLGASAHFAATAAGGKVSHITGVRYKSNRYLFNSMQTTGDYDPSFFDVQSFWTITPLRRVRLALLGYYARNRYRFEPENRETTFGTMADTKSLKIYFEGQEDDRYNTGIVGASGQFKVADGHSLELTASMYRSMEQERYDILGEYWLQQAEAANVPGADESMNIGVGGYMEHARNELFGEIYSVALRGSDALGRHKLEWELKAQKEHFDDYTDEWQYTDSAGYISQSPSAIEFARVCRAATDITSERLSAFVSDNVSFDVADGRLSVNAGVRLSRWSANGELLVSPRVALRFNRQSSVFRLSVGRYCQAPMFRELLRADGTANTDVKAQKSWQVLAGADHYFTADNRPFKFTVEAYYKHLTDVNPYSIDNVRIRYAADNNAVGYAAGIDMKINGELVEGVESWASLSVMRTKEDIDGDGVGYIPRPSDQRVSFSLFLQDYLPSNQSVGASLAMYMATGLPFGPPEGGRRAATNRMPGYKRVDLGLFKDFAKRADGTQKGKFVKSARVGVEVFNLFDFSNTISYFWVSDVKNNHFAVPNYLTSRRINVKLSVEF